jgi:hypothetical protein
MFATKVRTALVVLTAALAPVASTAFLAEGTAVAKPKPIKIGTGKGCKDKDGKEWPEFSKGKDQHGREYICIDGQWRLLLSARGASTSQPTTGPTTRPSHVRVVRSGVRLAVRLGA